MASIVEQDSETTESMPQVRHTKREARCETEAESEQLTSPRTDPPRTRDQGDGAYSPAPVSPTEVQANTQNQRKPFRVEVDLLQVALTMVALVTRLWQLEHPKVIVFDELNYGRYAQMYCKRQFFFDIHPPLGKMMIGAIGHLAGFDLDFNFDTIGTGYLPSVPIWYLRLLPAVFGSLLVPITYQLFVELRFAWWTAALAACFIIGDNALLTQSRFMLIDTILLFFMAAALYSMLKFRQVHRSAPFSGQWWLWLALLGISFTCAISTKYVGIYTAVLTVVLVGRELWKLLPDPSLSNLYLWKHLCSYVLLLVLLPLGIYLSIFYIHLRILYKAGPHDDIMTSGFQASLEGGLAAITRGQPLEVVYGSQVTLRNSHSSSNCWLHSHDHLYPLRYKDKRGSSHQQQVTCYSFKDVNNWWIIKDPASDKVTVNETLRPVKHGDVIQIMHGISSRMLNSHDVAAPLSPQNQEVSCYIDYNVSMPCQDLWRVEIINREQEGDTWLKIRSYVRLTHISTEQVLKLSGKQLPEWGFHQFEVVTDRVVSGDSAVWNVEEHKYTKEPETKDGKVLQDTEMLPLEPTVLSFFVKFWELQYKMLTSRRDAMLEHRFSSQPSEWPFMDRNIGYWMGIGDHSQIHLIGNPVMWFSGTAAVFIYAALLSFYMLRRRRLHYDISPELWSQFVNMGQIFLAGYFLHYLPFFAVDRTMFLYHYLPALYFKLMLMAAMVEHIYHILKCSVLLRYLFNGFLLIWLTLMTDVFVAFSALSYGTPILKAEDMYKFMWRESWDFIIH